jgi:hypothetical protein
VWGVAIYTQVSAFYRHEEQQFKLKKLLGIKMQEKLKQTANLNPNDNLGLKGSEAAKRIEV